MNLVMNLVMNVECVYQRSMNDAWVNILLVEIKKNRLFFDPESFCLEEECSALDRQMGHCIDVTRGGGG